MKTLKLVWAVVVFLVLGVIAPKVMGNDFPFGKCKFPAIFSFGDSNADTGGLAALHGLTLPNGGRSTNGRQIIDIIAERFKLPYLDAYLDSIGTTFRHGANFAVAGAYIVPGCFVPSFLERQVSQFIHFKARTIALYRRHSSKEPKEAVLMKSKLPRLSDFSKALYIIDIGQNDLKHIFCRSVEQVRINISNILSGFSQSISHLYTEGARFIWVLNVGPLGCLPSTFTNNRRKIGGHLDRYGCAESVNEVVQEFNWQLKRLLSKLRVHLPRAVVTYIDVYKAKYLLTSTATKQGFTNPMISCWPEINGTASGGPCKNPSRHVSWDDSHYTDAANQWIVNRILTGSLSDPPLSIKEACPHK